ncbi:PAP2 superfamily [Longilinea arvoryzae]|uniref:PAP2 superfamily n=2 Tax=Longilinea arvoryzae TaxID=360412 RepID=A0A0S7BN97_9CHLR|nr:PAP2 superfamily [Longilinea arvoryzae]
MDFDSRISRRVRLHQDGSPAWKLAVFFAHSGDSWFWMAGLVVVWLFARGFWHNHTALLAIGVGVLAVLVLAIKFTIRRQRPEGEWGAIYRNTDPHSFPSGHAARAAMLAVMAWGLGPAWFGWVVLIWAPLVSLARVSTGVHYLSDILAGWVLGVLAGFAMLAIAPLLVGWFPFLF